MEIYEHAIEDAVQKHNTEVLPDLYTNFAQFKYVVGNRGLYTDIKYAMHIFFYAICFLQRHLHVVLSENNPADIGLFLYMR